MTLTELKYIVAVARTKHFGRAAVACHVAQPTLSVAIKKLEDELGVILFERGGAEISVTPMGLQIIAQAERVLEQTTAIKELAKQNKDPLAGPLRLGVIYTIGPYLLPPLVTSIIDQVPQMPLILQENFTLRLLELVRQGELDSEILADVYLELIGGRQAGLALVAENRISGAEGIAAMVSAVRRPVALPSRVSAEAQAAHAALIATMGAEAIWAEYAGQ